jgi:hypothetical protein
MLIKLKFQFPEIVIGILLTVAIFAVGMVFESSRKPPNNQQEQSTTKSPAQISHPSSADERIADYTLAVAWLTGVLAISTVGLWVVTVFAFRHSRKTAERQLRAFVFGKGFDRGLNLTDGKIEQYLFFVTFENVGLTPATDVRSKLTVQNFPMSEDKEPIFDSTITGPATVVGPRGTSQSTFVGVSIQTMMENWRHETEIFVWSRIEYRDIFQPEILHHHEQCARVELIHEPDAIPPEGHPSYVLLTVYGPQNSTG